MTPQEIAKLERRAQGKRNRAQGAFFEQMIEQACEYYRAREIADIEKTPEPMQPTKDLGNGHFIAHYTGTAQADYKGFLMGGRAVNFEAKYTDTGRMTQDRVTPDQTKRLERAHRYGAHAFVLCSFGAVAFYRVPWEVWRDMKTYFGHKYITPQEAAPYEVRIGGPGVPLFLEGVSDSKIGLWREHRYGTTLDPACVQYYCSVCGKVQEDFATNYCPRCGTAMVGVEKEGTQA